MLLYLVPLFAFDFIYPRRQLPDAAPTAAVLVADVFLSLFFYDLFFTISHIAMHQVRPPFQRRVPAWPVPLDRASMCTFLPGITLDPMQCCERAVASSVPGHPRQASHK